MSDINIKTIFEHIKKDTTLLTNLDIPDLLSKIEKSDYLEGKTLKDIQDEKVAVLEGLQFSDRERADILQKLEEYRYIKNIFELHKGKHIRWITLSKITNGIFREVPLPSSMVIKDGSLELDRGAILSDIKFTDTGTILQCLRYDYRVFNIKMDDRIIFQKMNTEELLLLAVNEQIINGRIKSVSS